jgi:hypothetical protein
MLGITVSKLGNLMKCKMEECSAVSGHTGMFLNNFQKDIPKY